MAPPVTLGATSALLDGPTIFTAIAFLNLLALPLSDVFRSVAPLMAGLACLGRIQAYLDEHEREDFQQLEAGKCPEKAAPAPPVAPVAISIVDGTFAWEKGSPCLKKINLEIPRSRLTMIVGPTASGKSTLCKSLLGETIMSEGQVIWGGRVGKIGYCDQTPFLENQTIRNNIMCYSKYDSARYQEVLMVSMLVQDLSQLPGGDETFLSSNGINLSGGQRQRVALARALYAESDLLIFDDVLSGLDADTEKEVFNRVFGPVGLLKRRDVTVVLCTHSVRHLPSSDHIIALSDEGKVLVEGSWHKLSLNNKYIQSLEITESSEDSSATDTPDHGATALGQTIPTARPLATTVKKSVGDAARRNGDMSVYKHYFRSVPLPALAAFVFSCLIYGGFYNFPTIWIQYWSSDVTAAVPNHTKAYWASIYALFSVLALLGCTVATYLGLNYMAIVSGAALHQYTLRTVTRAPLSFFSTTDVGMTTNHFSQDMTLIDGELPALIINFSTDVAVGVGMAGVLAATSPFLVIAYPPILAVLYVVQKFYLRTSRQVRLLDLEAKSPLYAHFLDTAHGIATIRAFGWTAENIERNQRLLEVSQRPAYLLAMIQRWLLFTLNLFVLLLAVLAVTLSTQLSSNTGFTGSGLLTLMQPGQFMTSIVQCYAKLETSMGAVSRLKSFREETKPESQVGEGIVPPPSWPARGKVELAGVSASYLSSSGDTTHELCLQNLELIIEPGQKIAICGRTGSGKSSLILLLLRLLDPLPSSSQNIIIDGLPLHQVDRDTLRQRIIALPQDAIFLPAGTTIQDNLDPYGLCTTAECQWALEQVGLEAIAEPHGGLKSIMKPDRLSQGQKQLFSVARALLRRQARSSVGSRFDPTAVRVLADGTESGGILLLDEVSASVDRDTERSMLNVIKREFAKYTIVMVTHRLDAVMEGFDRVVVLESGAVVEDGDPHELVRNESGWFRHLRDAT